MHNLLQKLAREIVRAESIDNPGKRRYLVDVEDIRDVFTDKTGTENVLGIYLDISDIKEPLFIDEKSFEGMLKLQFLKVSNDWRRKSEGRVYVPQGLAYLSRKLRLLQWNEYPCKCLPSNFKAEFLVELIMVKSKLEKLWEGTQPLRSLKKMYLSYSRYFKEIPDLSNAINLEELHLYGCESLVTLPSSIQNAINLRELNMENCTKLENLPTLRNLKSLEELNLKGCFRLRNFPHIGNLKKLRKLFMKGCTGLEVLPTDVNLSSLKTLDLSGCKRLRSFPLISWNINNLRLNDTAIEEVPSTIGNFKELVELEMKGCTVLEVLPTVFNLSFLQTLDLSGCKRLRSFPLLSWRIISLNLNDTAIEEVPCCIKYFSNLTKLSMRGCKRLKNISPNIFKWRRLERVDFSECVAVVTALGDAIVVETTEDCIFHFMFNNCINLDGDAHELILRSYSRPTFLPGGRVPNYFTHRASTNFLTVTLPQSSLSQEFLGFKACIVLEPITYPNDDAAYLKVCWLFRDRWQCIHLKLKLMYNTDHLLLVPLKFRNIAPPSELDYNDVTFEFSVADDDYVPSPFQRIKGCGISVLEMSPSPAGSKEREKLRKRKR